MLARRVLILSVLLAVVVTLGVLHTYTWKQNAEYLPRPVMELTPGCLDSNPSQCTHELAADNQSHIMGGGFQSDKDHNGSGDGVRRGLAHGIRPSTSPETRHVTPKGFILGIDYSQQLGSGIKGFIDLAVIASLLNLTIVEPYIQESKYRGVPDVTKKDLTLNLGSLFNMSDVQKYLEYCCPNSSMASFESFLGKTLSNVVFLIFFRTHQEFFKGSKFTEICQNTNDCSYSKKDMLSLNKWASLVMPQRNDKLISSHVLAIDARPSTPLKLSVITEELGTFLQKHTEQFGSTTVIINEWHGIKNSSGRYYYYIPEWAWQYSNRTFDVVKHSELVINTAFMFAKSMNYTHPVIGVHIRAEHFVLKGGIVILKGGAEKLAMCLEEVGKFLHNINATNQQVHVFHDYGKQGSFSYWRVYNKLSYIPTKIKDLGFPVVSFNPSQFGSLNSLKINRAFVALVEQEYLSRTDVLVAVGYGGFTTSIVKRFLIRSKGDYKNLHRICEDRDKH